jgi:two-component system response regulator FlrC
MILPLDQVEKRAILEALELCKGNRTHAARQLGISIRTMRNKLKEYGVVIGSDSELEGEE